MKNRLTETISIVAALLSLCTSTTYAGLDDERYYNMQCQEETSELVLIARSYLNQDFRGDFGRGYCYIRMSEHSKSRTFIFFKSTNVDEPFFIYGVSIDPQSKKVLSGSLQR